MSGIESGSGGGLYLAYGALIAFVVLLLVIVARTAGLYALLLILPAARLLRWIPPVRRALDRLTAPPVEPPRGE